MGEVNKPEFKPCPFCGGEAKEHDLGNITVIRCSQCGAEQMARHRSGAVMLWQARAEPQADENFIAGWKAAMKVASSMRAGKARQLGCSGMLCDEHQFNFEKGWKEGSAALRKKLHAIPLPKFKE